MIRECLKASPFLVTLPLKVMMLRVFIPPLKMQFMGLSDVSDLYQVNQVLYDYVLTHFRLQIFETNNRQESFIDLVVYLLSLAEKCPICAIIVRCNHYSS